MNVPGAACSLLSLPFASTYSITDSIVSVLLSCPGTGISQPFSGKWHCLDKSITFAFLLQRIAVGARFSFSAGKHYCSLKVDSSKGILMFL